MSTGLGATPGADILINEALAARLIKDHCPQYSGLPLRVMDAGWDNVMVRIGRDLALRLPRRAAADPLIQNEQKWLPWLAPRLTLPVPVPIASEEPTDYYPFHWSLQKWLPGKPADLNPPNAHQAPILAAFLRALHDIDLPDDPPANPARSCPLSDKAPDIERRMRALKKVTGAITPKIERLWAEAVNAPPPTGHCFISGDIHARNVLTQEGRLSAIIDWGDMCKGDPATDMMGIWGLFEDQTARAQCLDIYGADPQLVTRAKGWAIFSGVLLLHTGLTDTPRHARMGQDVLRRAAADA